MSSHGQKYEPTDEELIQIYQIAPALNQANKPEKSDKADIPSHNDELTATFMLSQT